MICRPSKCRMKWNAPDSIDTSDPLMAKMTFKTILSTVENELSAMMECP